MEKWIDKIRKNMEDEMSKNVIISIFYKNYWQIKEKGVK